MCFQAVDPPTRLLCSATGSVPRPNYYLPPLAEPEPEAGAEWEVGGTQKTAPWLLLLSLMRAVALAPLDRVCPSNHLLVAVILAN